MIVVSDTSPLTALLSVGEAEILPKLFERVVIPTAVSAELKRGHTTLPIWLQVQPIQNLTQANLFARVVDLGEAEAITLAKEIRADYLLIDERKGRLLATQEGIPIVGLLGVILIAKKRGLVPSARKLLARLQKEAGVYLADSVKEAALKSAGE
jgi:predicted nucleic acid-binding protein